MREIFTEIFENQPLDPREAARRGARPQLRKQGCEVEIVGVNDGAIRLRVETGSHTCGSTAKTAQTTLEGAVYDAAPDLTSLVIEGLEEKPASGFVALDKLTGSPPAATLEPQGAD